MAEMNVNQTPSDQTAGNSRAPTVRQDNVFGWHDEHAATILRTESAARINVAASGIHTLTAILMQREIDHEVEGENLMVIGPNVAGGILNAIACCAEVIENAMQAGAFTTQIKAGSLQDRKLQAIEHEAHKGSAAAHAAAWGDARH